MPLRHLSATMVWALLLAACAGNADTYVPVPAEREDLPPTQVPSPTEQAEQAPQQQPEQPEQNPDPEETSPEETSSPQSQSCSDGAVSFQVDKPLAACAGVDLVVKADQGYVWVLIGIQAPDSPVSWRGQASASCDGGDCTWTFAGVTVPCVDGPYTLHFMVDATGDDHTSGHTVGSCVP